MEGKGYGFNVNFFPALIKIAHGKSKADVRDAELFFGVNYKIQSHLGTAVNM